MATFSGDNNAGAQINESFGDISIYNFGRSASEEQLRMRQECHQLFRIVGAKDEGYEWYKDRIHDRIDGTCEWFLTHVDYRSWISRKSGPLLVSADPGCGKSVLAKFLVDHELKGTVCYFFFKDKDQNTLRQALCALLHQLISKQPHLVDFALPEYKQNGNRLVQLSHALWRILLRASAGSTAGSVTFVLDALDECEEADMQEFFRLITELFSDNGARGDQVKFLLTTRPYQSVVTELWRLSENFPNIRIPGEDHSEQISNEVNLVVKDQVLRLARKFKLQESITEHLERKLLSIQHRTYLWVYLVFNYLNQGFRKTLKGIQDAIEHVPKSVYQAYEDILLKSTNQTRAKRAFEIIIAASSPLTVHEMNIASCIEPSLRPQSFEDLDLEDDEDFKISLRGYCGLFISIHHEKVYLLHQTAREFLLGSLDTSEKAPTSTNSWDWQGSIYLQEAHGVLTTICLTYVLFSNFELENDTLKNSTDPLVPRVFPKRSAKTFSDLVSSFMLVTASPGPASAKKALMNLFHFHESSQAFAGRTFLVYSCMNWHIHFRLAGDAAKSEMISLGVRACSPTTAFGLWAKQLFAHTFVSGITDEIIRGDIPSLSIAAVTGLDVIVRKFADTEDVNRQDADGLTALHYSVLLDYRKITLILLRCGAKPSIKSRSGHTSLHCAVLPRGDPIVQTLLPGPSALNRTHDVMLPKDFTILDNSVLKLLLESGAEVNAKDRDGCTALHLAMTYSTPRRLKKELEIYTIEMENIRCLLKNGAEPNAKDNRGTTALHLAARFWGCADIVTLFLEYHADINQEDDDGMTPLDIAEQYFGDRHFKVALREAGGELHMIKPGG